MASRVHEWADMQRNRWSNAWHDTLAKSLLRMRDLLGGTGPLPDRIHAGVPLAIDADPALAEAIFAGRYVFGPDVIDVEDPHTPWATPAPTPAWAEELHGFDWLDHFRLFDENIAGAEARARIDSWMSEKGRWDPIAWRPHVTARRLISWFVHSQMIMTGADPVWRSSFLRNVSRQAAHLARTARWAPEGGARMTAAIGLSMSGICMPHGEARRDRGLHMVSEELDRQILPDGGHLSRNPEALLRVLIDLINLKSAMVQQRVNLPECLQHAFDRIFTMIRFFQHGDGGLAYFNGASPLDPAQVEAVLAYDETGGRPISQANQSGYQRLVRKDTCILIDAGAPPTSAMGAKSHAGCLSFEFSHGPQRVIVNCGAAASHSSDWQSAMRSTAAHSTLAIAETSSCSFYPFNPSADYEDGRVIAGPRDIICDRRETGEGATLFAAHDGYARRFGAQHSREIFLSADGRTIRGADTLGPAKGRSTVSRGRNEPLTARFHLHPDVEVAMDGPYGVRLDLPTGAQWLFEAEGGAVSVTDSTYADQGGRFRRSQQIVIQSTVAKERTEFLWRLSFVDTDLRAGYGTTRKEAATPHVPLNKPGTSRTPISVLKGLGKLNAPALDAEPLVPPEAPECAPLAYAPDNPLQYLNESTDAPPETKPAREDDWPPVRTEDVMTLDPTDEEGAH
jgi:uncharacterized heparinase superfamily protein